MDDDKNKPEENPVLPPKTIEQRFDSIQLPPEDGEKPADINLDVSEGDDGIGKPTKKIDGDEDKPEEKEENLEEEKKPEVAEEDEDKKLPPFHEHPDWKKMKQENDSLKEQYEALNKELSEIKKNTATTPEEKKEIKTAEERIQEDIDNGWTPKSQLELLQRNNEYSRQERAEREQAEKAEREQKEIQNKEKIEEQKKAMQKAVDTAVTELQLAADEEEKVYSLVQEWAKQGTIQVSPKTIGKQLELARDVIRNQAQKPSDENPNQDPEPEDQEHKKEQKIEARKKANSRISRSSGSGKNTQPEKKPLSKLRRSLDDIVLESSEALG